MDLPGDTREDCPERLVEACSRVALARAQRASSDAEDATEKLTVARLARWTAGAGGADRRPELRRTSIERGRSTRRPTKSSEARSTSSARPAAGAAAAAPSSTGTRPATCTSVRRGARSEPRAIASALSSARSTATSTTKATSRRRDNYARLAVELMTADGVPTRHRDSRQRGLVGRSHPDPSRASGAAGAAAHELRRERHTDGSHLGQPARLHGSGFPQ